MPKWITQHPKARRVLLLTVSSLAFSILFTSILMAMTTTIVESSIDSKNNGGSQLDISLQPFATGFNRPVGIVNAGDDRLFVLEREGIIRIVRPDGKVEATPYLSITTKVESVYFETGFDSPIEKAFVKWHC